jgi:hypothetical protein
VRKKEMEGERQEEGKREKRRRKEREREKRRGYTEEIRGREEGENT